MNSGRWWWTGKRWWTGRPWRAAIHRVAKSWTRLSNWTELNWNSDSVVENLPAKSGNVVWIPETRKSPGEGNGNPLQYSCLRNPMDRGVWRATYNPWGLKELDTTEWPSPAHSPFLNQPSSPLGVLGVEMCAWDFLQCDEVYPWPWMRGSVLVCVCAVWRGGWRQRKKTEEVKVKVAQSCPTLCDPLDYTVPGILQARIQEWVALPSPGDLSNPEIKPRSPTLQADSLTSWATREAQEYWNG